MWSFAAISGFTALIGGRFLRHRAHTTTAEINVTLGNKSLTVNAMYDSGNLLKDCVSGHPVIVIDEKHVPNFFVGLKSIELDSINLLDSNLASRISLVPYSTASGEKTMVAFRPHKLTVTLNESTSEVIALIGFAKIKRTLCNCSALLPSELL